MSGPSTDVRVTIVDDHALFAESVAITLEAEGYRVRRVDLSGADTTLAGVLATVQRSHPRIVLLDLELGHVGDGTRLIAPLASSGVTVIVITGSVDRTWRGECLRRGAKAVMSKTRPLNDVIATVRRARDGLPLMTPAERNELVAAAVAGNDQDRELRARLDSLTRREMEVLGALMRGEQVREIARASVVSEATVRTQVKSILSKMALSSQISAVGAAYRVGWHPPTD